MSKTKDESVWVTLARIRIPVETWGICKNARRKKMCPVVPTLLGDGYCQKCWDRGCPDLTSKSSPTQTTKKKRKAKR